MKQIFVALSLLTAPVFIQAQTDSIKMAHAFAITDYMQPLNDSMTVVQVQLPDASPVHIPEKLMGVLKHRYENGTPLDTGMIGYGRCQLVKGDYYYFALKLQKGQRPAAGDLLYAVVKLKAAYKSMLLQLAAHQIQLLQVDETPAYRMYEIYGLKGAEAEHVILDSLVADIRYTGREMLKQSPGANQQIEGGLFDGKKLFDAMQAVTRIQLIEFLKYIIARPGKYAGHHWKVSEIFATWMVSKTPQVVE